MIAETLLGGINSFKHGRPHLRIVPTYTLYQYGLLEEDIVELQEYLEEVLTITLQTHWTDSTAMSVVLRDIQNVM